MRPDALTEDDYFDTPARAERLQLLFHLMRNADGPVYLRAPAGAGKTVFAGRLRAMLGADARIVWLDLAEPVKLVAELIRQLGLPPEAADDWPTGLLKKLDDRQLIVVADAVDQADAQTLDGLRALVGAGVGLLMVGRGGSADEGDVQFVDLPPFAPSESGDFLRKGAGPDAARITDDLVAASHIAAGGLPGGLLEVLHGLPRPTPPPMATVRPSGDKEASMETKWSGSKSPTAEDVMRGKKGALWPWVGAGALGLLFVTVLVFQDRINAVLTPAEEASSANRQAMGDALPAPSQRSVLPLPPPESDRGAGQAEPSAPELAEPAPGDAEPVDRARLDTVVAVERGGAGLQKQALLSDGPSSHEGVPSIALPELSRPAEAAPESNRPPGGAAEVATPIATEPAKAPLSTDGDAASDALDAVLEDALTAAAGEPQGASRQSAELTPSDGAASASPSSPSPAGEPTAETAETETESEPPPVSQTRLEGNGAAAMESGAAPVEDRSIAAPVKTPEMPVGARSAWLNSRDAKRYTLQLVGARDRASIEKFIVDHSISPPFAIFERELDGRPWYALIAGDYPDRAAAIAAGERLPVALQNAGIWPRTFASVQASR